MVRIRPGDRDKYPPRAPSKPWGGNPIFDKNDFSGGNFFEAGLEAAERDLMRNAYLGETFKPFPWKLVDRENDLGDGMLFKNAF